eukprot:2881395-Ditylum_brightwellii.AAC.1
MDEGVVGLVVGLNRGWLLGVTYCFQEVAEAHRCLAVVEQRAAFCFCCRANNVLECSALNEDRGIVWCLVVVEGVRIGRTVEIAGDAAFYTTDNKIGSIGVNMQLHVSSKEAEHCVW